MPPGAGCDEKCLSTLRLACPFGFSFRRGFLGGDDSGLLDYARCFADWDDGNGLALGVVQDDHSVADEADGFSFDAEGTAGCGVDEIGFHRGLVWVVGLGESPVRLDRTSVVERLDNGSDARSVGSY